MENYLMLNGKRIDLTAEQIETLVGKKEKDPFEMEVGKDYYTILGTGEVIKDYFSRGCKTAPARYNVANYCTDKELMEQRALHVILNQQLWRYSMQHGGRECDWGNMAVEKWLIKRDGGDIFVDSYYTVHGIGEVAFASKEAAEAAIEEIVKPFMEKHPEFRW